MDNFEATLRAKLSTIVDPEIHATVTHKDPNKPNPGIGSLVIDPATWAARYTSHAVNAAQDWFDRATNPSKDPIKSAIAANKKRIDRFNLSEQQGKWLKKMGKLTFDDVAGAIQKAGTAAYTTGINNKSDKAAKAFAILQPKVLALKQTIQALPDATDQDRANRMLAARKGMIAIGGS